MPNFGLISSKSHFERLLDRNEIDLDMIVFIEDTKEVWAKGNYYGASSLLEDRVASLENLYNTIHPTTHIKNSHISLTQEEYDFMKNVGTIDDSVFYYIYE